MPRLAQRSRGLAAVPSQPARPMAAYARVSKGAASRDAAGTTKSSSIGGAGAPVTRKRKAAAAAAVEARSPAAAAGRTVSFPPSSEDEAEAAAPPKRACRRTAVLPSRPARGGQATAKPTPARTAKSRQQVGKAKATDDANASQNIQTSTKPKLQITTSSAKTSPATQDQDDPLPPQFADLVRLNKAFLQTVSLHMAHTGGTAPIDIRVLAPDVSRTWGRRTVTVEDIRRCVAILGRSAPSPFVVSDYGRGRVCVELAAGAGSINEERLVAEFRRNMAAICAERALDDMLDVGASLEGLKLDDLPQAAITDKGSAAAMANPLLARGHRALDQFKSGLEAKQQELAAKEQAAIDNPMLNADGTRMSLLDRLRLKEQLAQKGGEGPTVAERQRRAALNRVVDVAATLSMLSLASPLAMPRQAFTMRAVTDRLRDSLRVPLGAEEAAGCLRLMAAEVAPEWLRVVCVGGRETVVIQRDRQPVDRVLHERVHKLLG